MESTQTHSPRNEQSCPVNPPEEPDPYFITTLPAELLQNIFSRLSLRDQLEVREVCLRFSQVLPLSTFSNSSKFVLDPTTDAYSILLSSGADWKHIQINGLASRSESQDWFRSLFIRRSLKRLVFRNSLLAPSFLQSSLLEFPHLEELEFINSKLEKGMIGAEVDAIFCEEFLRIKLKSLTFEVEDPVVLSSFLTMFTCAIYSSEPEFVELGHEVFHGGNPFYELAFNWSYIDAGACLEQLVIRMTSTSRKAATFRYAMTLLRILIGNCSSSLRDFSYTDSSVLSLEELWKYCLSPTVLANSERRMIPRWRTLDVILSKPDPAPFLIHRSHQFHWNVSSFLRSQPYLTSFSLPFPSTSDMAQLADLADSLPSHLETIHVGCTTAAFHEPQFMQKLTKVKNMTLYFLNDQFQNFNRNPLTHILHDLESLVVLGQPGRLGFTLANSFPNLRKLIITCSSEEDSADALNDDELQLIIANFPCLIVLKLSSCARITDFGVAGILQEEAVKLLCNRTDDLDGHHIVRKGLALQNLQGLEELSLKGSSQISDVGVQFGLVGFRNLRQLDLATAHRGLTCSGLVRMTKFNSRLERLQVETSHLGNRNRGDLEQVLCTHLKSNGKWKRIDVSIRLHTETPLRMVQLSQEAMQDLMEMLHLLREIRTYDKQAKTRDDEAPHQAHPAEVYQKWREDKIFVLMTRYPKLSQAQKDLLSISTSLPQYAHLFKAEK